MHGLRNSTIHFQDESKKNEKLQSEDAKKANKSKVNETFSKNVASVMETSYSREKQLENLFRGISEGFKDDAEGKSAGCWPFFRMKKSKIEKEPLTEPTLHSSSVPFVNRSFYHYKARSRLEGLSFIPNKIYDFGEKGSGLYSKSGPQNFYKLREQCLEKRKLFEDPEFPAKNSSLFYSQKPDRKFEWKRPKEIVRAPQLCVEGYSRFDVQQGELGDCWLLAAMANLTLYSRLFTQIVPMNQSFDEDYAGIFHFRFWQNGRWVDVSIDDRLPTFQGELVYLHSNDVNEFWSALLEKAYAKLHGSYEALRGGSTCESMEDLTGGLSEIFELRAPSPHLFKIILKAYERWSLMSCSMDPDPEVVEAETPEGLIKGHAYSITKVQYIYISKAKGSVKVALLRLRNPWGDKLDWKGAWSNRSPEWNRVSEKQKKAMDLSTEADGEFWMSYTDFGKHFDRLEICNLNPDSLYDCDYHEDRNKRWIMSVFEGEWVHSVTAGGCRNFLDTFHHNPQYCVTLEQVDDEDDDNKCTLIVALMQKNRRQMRRNIEEEVLTIGFAIYHLPFPDKVPKPLDLNFFKYNASIARSPSFINLREVCARYKLPKGTYCIVPSTFEPNKEGAFLLRVFSEHLNNMEENDQQIGLAEEKDLPHPKLTTREIKENEGVLRLFKEIAGEDGKVNWRELKEILDYYTKKETKNKGFSKDVCRSMVAMSDVERTGTLNFEEFKTLWTSIRLWKKVFKDVDKDNSGTLSGFQLREALASAGYTLNNRILNILMQRYGNKNREIEFDDFITCAVKLKVMIELFKELSSPATEEATFSLDDWVEYTLYA